MSKSFMAEVSSCFIGVKKDNYSSYFVVECPKGNVLVKLNSNHYIGEDESTPPNLVIQKEGRNVFQPAIPNLQPTKPIHFSAYLSKDVLDQTGDGQIATFKPDKIIENVGNHYDPTTGVFTAPVSGLYQFDCKILSILKISQTVSYQATIALKIGAHTYPETMVHGYPFYKNNPKATYSTSKFGFMEAAQTAMCTFVKYGPTRFMDFYGSETIPQSSFSGYLLTKA